MVIGFQIESQSFSFVDTITHKKSQKNGFSAFIKIEFAFRRGDKSFFYFWESVFSGLPKVYDSNRSD